MESSKVIKLLKERLKQLECDPKVKSFSGGTFRAWATSVDNILARAFGHAGARLRARWQKATHSLPWPTNIFILGSLEGPAEAMFKARLPEVQATLQAIIEEVRTFGPPAIEQELPRETERPRVFIAHGPCPEVVEEVKRFLSGLGIEPIVLEEQANVGRSVDEKLEHYLVTSDCGLVIATADDVVNFGKQPRGNVLHEVGRMQERFESKVIYLLEEGASFPSNITSKVWERFRREDVGRTFIRIAQELVSFGVLRSLRPPKGAQERPHD